MKLSLAFLPVALAATALGALECNSSVASFAKSLAWDTFPTVDASVFPGLGGDGGADGGAVQTGGACAVDTDCAGASAVCRHTLYNTDGSAELPIPGGECASACQIANDDPMTGVDPECPGVGTCVKNVVLGAICYQGCTAATGYLPCRVGFSCAFGPANQGECAPSALFACNPSVGGTCTPDADGGAQSCQSAGPDPVGDCVPGCHPVTQDCPSGGDAGPMGCYPGNSSDGLCFGAGSREAGAGCVYTNDCAPGLTCTATTLPDGGSGFACVQLCGGPTDAGCAAGLACKAYSPTTPQSTLGFCLP